jgi:hypothetical protein
MDTQKFTLLIIGLFLWCASGLAQRNCGSMEYLEQQIQHRPERLERLQQIEEHTQRVLTSSNRNVTGVIMIPVVVHVVYNVNNPAENISDAQIQSQINILNEDFRRMNPDAPNTPAMFQGVAADSEFEFCLASVDPSGNPTSGITRTPTTVNSFSSNNSVKFNSSGGHDAWPADQYMNFWVCDLSGGLLGYAQFPGGPSSTDGIVCDYLYVGNIGTATAPFDLGRTATHEVGHWLNLLHIWGDGGCGVDDFVTDTPLAGNPNYNGLPCSFPGGNSCNSGAGDQPDMFQNYMDYSDDGCMNLFTLGQKDRMRALFAPGGFRESLLTASNCSISTSCNDGIQNGQETGVDCGGPDCPACPTCFDGIQNGQETGVDCGGPDCPACFSCNDGIQNGQETGVDCGGPDCPACPSCNDGVQNGDEEGIDCGGANCPPCAVPCNENSLELAINFDLLPSQVTWEVLDGAGTMVAAGGPYASGNSNSSTTEYICLPDGCYEFTIYDSGGDGLCCRFGFGSYSLSNAGNGALIASGGNYGDLETTAFCLGSTQPTCFDGIQNGDEQGVDCGGSSCPPCGPAPSCNDGIQNGQETGVDCGGPACPACPTCFDGIQNGDEQGVDCGGSSCPPCGPAPSCNDGIQNGQETGIDCGGPACPACPTCFDGIQNGDEQGVDCGGSNCQACGPVPSCNDGIQNGQETGIDCGGPDCPPCSGGCPYELTLTLRFDLLPNQSSWEITDDAGQVVYSGGPYNNQAANSTLEIEGLCLSAGCYSFTMFDSGNNGMCCRFGKGEYELVDGSGTVLAYGNAFNSSEQTDFCLGNNRTGASFDSAALSWEIYPVPAKDELQIDYKVKSAGPVRLVLTSLTGHMISDTELDANAGANRHQLDASEMPAGVYFLHMLYSGKKSTKRFVVIK